MPKVKTIEYTNKVISHLASSVIGISSDGQFKPPKKEINKRNQPQRNSVILMESLKQKQMDKTLLDVFSRMVIDVSMAVSNDKYGEL